MEDQIKVGDFGLVTKAGNDQSLSISMTPRTSIVDGAAHTLQVGTQMYMAPEQVCCLLTRQKLICQLDAEWAI